MLGLRPAAKYATTWERIAKAVRDHVPGARQREAFHHLATTLLLTYALRNADCHAKNIALLYTSHKDVCLSPVYDMLTTSVYAGYRNSPPAISFMGKKTWAPGRTLERFIAATFGIAAKEQVKIIDAIGDAVSVTAVQVREAMAAHPGFADTGKRMLISWHEGVSGLRNPRTYAMGTRTVPERLLSPGQKRFHEAGRPNYFDPALVRQAASENFNGTLEFSFTRGAGQIVSACCRDSSTIFARSRLQRFERSSRKACSSSTIGSCHIAHLP